MRRRAPFLSLLTLSAAAAFQVATAYGVDAATAAKINPFKPASGGDAPAAASSESIEFAGVSQLGKTTHLIFHDKAAKKNRWVGLGETVEGITVVKYDERREQAVVKINGTEKTLALRKGTGPVNTPPPVAAMPAAAGFATPPAQTLPASQSPQIVSNTGAPATEATPAPAAKPPGPATPETQARQETEARMLVSDLLEIGMAQRRAYEEAQRRGAEAKSQPPAGEQPAQPAK